MKKQSVGWNSQDEYDDNNDSHEDSRTYSRSLYQNRSGSYSSNFSTLEPTMITEAPTSAPLSPSNISESFIQSFCGPEISFMDPQQITSWSVILSLLTPQYAVGEPIVSTKSEFIDQRLYQVNACPNANLNLGLNISAVQDFIKTQIDTLKNSTNTSNFTITPQNSLRQRVRRKLQTSSSASNSSFTTRELRVRFRMIWESQYFKISRASYVLNFTNFMNTPEAKNETIKNLNAINVKATEVSNVRITVPPLQPAPTSNPTLMPSTFSPSFSHTFSPSVNLVLGNGGGGGGGDVANVHAGSAAVMITILILVLLAVVTISIFKLNERLHFCDEFCCFHKLQQSITSTEMSMKAVFGSFSHKKIKDKSYTVEGNSHDQSISSNELFEEDTQANINTTANLTPPPPLTKKNSNNILTETQGADELEDYYNESLQELSLLITKCIVDIDEALNRAKTAALLLTEKESSIVIHKVTNTSEKHHHHKYNELEIEANMLYKATSFCKTKSTMEKRNKFVEEIILHQLVVCVIYNILSPRDASRIVHECCALVEMPLKQNLVGTTLVVSGLRKNVALDDIRKIFRMFGSIEAIALAPISNDFAFIRYKYESACMKAMEKYKRGEIVVQDVAVVIRLLSTSSTVKTVSHAASFINDDERSANSSEAFHASFIIDEQFDFFPNINDSVIIPNKRKLFVKKASKHRRIVSENNCYDQLVPKQKSHRRILSDGGYRSSNIYPASGIMSKTEEDFSYMKLRKSSSWPLLIDQDDNDDDDEGEHDDTSEGSIDMPPHLMKFSPYY